MVGASAVDLRFCTTRGALDSLKLAQGPKDVARAARLAPSTIGTLLEERFSEDELKQIAGIIESPVYIKFQKMGDEMQQQLIAKLVSDTRPTIEPKVRALEQTIAKRLGVAGPAPSGNAAPRAPAKPAAKPASK